MPLRMPELRTPFTRAVVPVAAGIGLFAGLGLVLWLIAAAISGGSQRGGTLTSDTFSPGSARNYAAIIAADGPLIFPDLLGTDGDRTIVLDHTGTDPLQNWRIYLAHPADRPLSCKVTQMHHTRSFTDCEGRTIDVAELALPEEGIRPIISQDGILSLDLIPDTTTTTAVA
ncbi:MAG: hypothetical protein QM733_07640 [Ilumatobacteraceae bacterium]